MFDPSARRGNVLVYAIFLTVLAMSLAYVFLSKSEILFENLSFQTYDSKMSKNLSAKAELALNWDASANSDGGWFLPALECPTAVTLSGTTESGSLETISTVAKISSGALYCEGLSGSWIPLRIDYSADYATFSTGTFANSVNLNPEGNAVSLSGTFSDSGATFVSFDLPTTFSALDGNLNSDDFRVGSSGSVAYPSSFADNDADARKTVRGTVRADSWWNSVFWNSPKVLAFIDKNPNNDDSVNAKLSLVSSGFLFIETDRPFLLKIVEFDSWAYLESSELVRTASEESLEIAAGSGYLQRDLTLSWSRSVWDNAKAFDFKNRLYAVFFAYPAQMAGTEPRLKYSLSVEAENGSSAYCVPLDDSPPASIKYLATDIVIDSSWNFRSKTLDFSVPKIGASAYWSCDWTWWWPLDGACIVPE